MKEIPNRTVFLDTTVIRNGKLFKVTHEGITRKVRFLAWDMDYDKRVSRFNFFIDFCDNMNQKLFYLPGNIKSIALEYEFVEHDDEYNLNTGPILDLINNNQNNRQVETVQPLNVKCLVIGLIGGSSYHVFPISLWFESVPSNRVSVGVPIVDEPDPNKQRLVINFNDVDVSNTNFQGNAS